MGGENRQREKEESARRAKKPRCRRSRLSCLSRSPSLSPSTSTFSFSGSTRPPRATPAPSPHRGTFGAPLPRPTLPSCSDSQLRSFRPPRFPFTHSKKTPSKPRNQKTLSPQACGDCACAPPPTSAAAFRDAKKTSTSGDACWVCLGEGTRSGDGGGRSGDGGCGTDCCADERLVLPCACPRPVHAACLARWQLHSAGTPEGPAAGSARGSSPTGRAC